MTRYIVLGIVALLLSSCGNRQPIESINGVWESVGSGWVLHINDSLEYALYDKTTISCLPNRKGKLGEIENSLAVKNDTLSLLKGIITYYFTKTMQLPELCQQPLNDEQAKDPLYNFEVFAETVKEHYAFMDLNEINWSTLYQQQKNKLDVNSTDAELYLVIEEMLEKLNDNHASLAANEEVYEEIELTDKKEDAAGQDNLPEIGDFEIAKMVTKHHLEEEMTEDSWLIQWGKLNDSIGYIQIKAMWLYADLEIPESLIDEIGYVDAYVKTFSKMYEGDYIEKEVQGVSEIMDKVMKDLSGMESIVIDARFNGGGQDAVSFEILSRFTSRKMQVATQKLKHGSKFSPTLPLYIEGTSSPYTKPIYVLTSQQTGSAAEAFAIATISMDNAKRIGSPTSGAMSTALEKSLPNGWRFSISNEIFMDNQGKNYENVGIPVNYKLDYPEDRQAFFRSIADDLERDKQIILNAIEKLEKE